MAGNSFYAYDQNNKPVLISLAKINEYYTNANGRRKHVNQELYQKYNGNEVKREAVVLSDELIETSSFDKKSTPVHTHDWLDNNGKNDFDLWTVVLQRKDKSVWTATLNIANAIDGRKNLYDSSKIKMVEGAAKSAHTTTTKKFTTYGS